MTMTIDGEHTYTLVNNQSFHIINTEKYIIETWYLLLVSICYHRCDLFYTPQLSLTCLSSLSSYLGMGEVYSQGISPVPRDTRRAFEYFKMGLRRNGDRNYAQNALRRRTFYTLSLSFILTWINGCLCIPSIYPVYPRLLYFVSVFPFHILTLHVTMV